ncbi:MAG: Lar family restriction alleviation protein [Thermoguttaceae bacterium]|nr:Lar family restriction alleviation protein [Thermoguttaceae bacterium]
MENEQTVELIPCPFCGSKVELSASDGGWCILCAKCGCRMENTDKGTLLDLWNDRYSLMDSIQDTPTLVYFLERLKKRLEQTTKTACELEALTTILLRRIAGKETY